MEKQKKWQLFLILSVIALTVYNILPTLFYYSKPLKSPLSEVQGEQIAAAIAKRVDQLEVDAQDWIGSFCQLIQVSPSSIRKDGQNFILSFNRSEEANRFCRFLPRAGSLIPFAPAQLTLAPQEENGKEVIVQSRIPIPLQKHLDLFSYAPKGSAKYRELIIDRAAQIAFALTGPTEAAYAVGTLDPRFLETLASQINSIAEIAEVNKMAANRFAASFTQGPFENRASAIQALISAFATTRDQLKGKKEFEKKEMSFITAEKFLKERQAHFASGQDPWNVEQIKSFLKETDSLTLGIRNPLFSELKIDWEANQILLKTHADSAPFEQPRINEIAKITRLSNESVVPSGDGYAIDFHTLSDFSAYLLLDVKKIAQIQAEQLAVSLKTDWNPKHLDLQAIKILDAATYETLPLEEKAFCLVVQADKGLRIIAKGIDRIAQAYETHPESEIAQTFYSDCNALNDLLQKKGLQGYRAVNGELVFEKVDFCRSLLNATREDFAIRGTGEYAFLELSNLEQRLLVENRIDTLIHEDLIKWKDEYNSAQVSIQPQAKFDVPKPTKSVLWSNLELTIAKLFRGDEKKVIRWGLDLSGGKTVQIELRDATGQVVKNDLDIKQGINELYNRVNKMGVSEVAIRQLGHQIVLDFPGSQSLSAAELIKASSMYFHIVNEKFSLANPSLSNAVNQFLQEVWNEAVVTHRKDAVSIQEIGHKHLHSDAISVSARTLLENGLTLASPADTSLSCAMDDPVSKIAVLRGAEPNEWQNQSHPLLIVFRNYVIEGSQLENIQASYDPQKGNFLSFEVQKGMARNHLHSWTARYSEEAILGTPLAEFSRGRGWRMAVLLNDTVISSPTLNSVLRDSASISGSFSQREVNQLASDLKAGSLTFTPHILSEKNVSPELGKQDRMQGILATFIALLLVVVSMIGYYRFAGFIASIAVLFNLLILWATLQHIGATLSLAGIAGIILTVGMAVDANVLVFERIKEEFALTGRIAAAIEAGYKKAYSAIIDSNVTTIIAALILLNFDAGPIKGFAITLIIGIVSSMFTALFMTRYYFTSWLQNPKNKALNMANWIQAQSIDFLKHSKFAFAIAAIIIVVGSVFVYNQRATIFGMDFTGGFSLHLEIEPRPEGHYLQAVETALTQAKATSRDFQIRELTPSNQLRILFGTSMEQPGKPFFGLPIATDLNSNPRIDWVVQTLQSNGLQLTSQSLAHLESNWTAMSGQMSDSMRNNALLGLFISFVCIFIYIAFRFEYKFAAAAIICLLHDVLITIGLMGLLHALGVPVQIDLNTVAAIMTIVGYSLNDTIIIFDRIREEMVLTRSRSLYRIVNSALNATLSRTLITSGTTLLVLIALVALGGSSIFSFALVMTIGVFFGTLSSWYIASPLMLFFHEKEERTISIQVEN